MTEPGADGLITWALGEIAAGTTRQLTFQVIIDEVEGTPGEVISVDILNAGAVQSDRIPRTESNEVITPVTAVLPQKIGQPEAAVLPVTGSTVPLTRIGGAAASLLALGLLLLVAGRRPART